MSDVWGTWRSASYIAAFDLGPNLVHRDEMNAKLHMALLALVFIGCGTPTNHEETHETDANQPICATLSVPDCEATDGCSVKTGHFVDPKRNCAQSTVSKLFCLAKNRNCTNNLEGIENPLGERFLMTSNCGFPPDWNLVETPISCGDSLSDKTVGQLTSEEIEQLCDYLPNPTECSNQTQSIPKDRDECVVALEQIGRNEPDKQADTIVRCWRDNCDAPFTGPCAVDCHSTSIEDCENVGCRLFRGAPYDQENMCFTNTEIPLFCDFMGNCNNSITVHRSPVGELFLGGAMCGLPRGWEWIDRDQTRCE